MLKVFFIDTSGALCSRSAGHAIDIEGMCLKDDQDEIVLNSNLSSGDRLVLRHRRPVSYPYPNAYAHPLPRFSYNGQAGEIEVTFITDPTYPSPTSAPSHTWKYKTYLLASMPLRQPKSMFDNATEFISSAITSPFNYLSGKSPVPQANPDAVFDGEIDLSDGDIVDEERGEESEIDDSLEAGRVVRMLSILDKDDHDRMLNEKARNRRKWQVMPLRTTNARTGAI